MKQLCFIFRGREFRELGVWQSDMANAICLLDGKQQYRGALEPYSLTTAFFHSVPTGEFLERIFTGATQAFNMLVVYRIWMVSISDTGVFISKKISHYLVSIRPSDRYELLISFKKGSSKFK